MTADPTTDHPELQRWAKDQRRRTLGKSTDRRVVKLVCSCGLTLGRLGGSTDGTYGGLTGIQKQARTTPEGALYTPSTVGPAGQQNVPADGGGVWKWSDVSPMFDRQRIYCTARSCGREWLYRRDTLASVYASAVDAGRRTAELGVDL